MTPNSTGEHREQINVKGENLAERVRQIIHEGNVSRVIVKHPDGHTIVEIPVTVGVIGVLLAPAVAALGAIGVLVAHCTVEVVRPTPPNPSNSDMPTAASSVGGSNL